MLPARGGPRGHTGYGGSGNHGGTGAQRGRRGGRSVAFVVFALPLSDPVGFESDLISLLLRRGNGNEVRIWAQAAGNVVGDAVVVEEPVTCSLVVGRVQDRVVDNDLGHWSAPPLSLPPHSSNKGRTAGFAPDL